MAELKFEKGKMYWAKHKTISDQPLLVRAEPDGVIRPLLPLPQDLAEGTPIPRELWEILGAVEPPKPETPAADITKLNGYDIDFKGGEWPSFNPPVLVSPDHNPYFERPGVVLVAKPVVNAEAARYFVESFDAVDPTLQFKDYFKDPMPFSELPPAEALTKLAAQTCYLSFQPKRSKNADAQQYLDHIKQSGHGSVLEHANFTFLLYGLDRSATHELVRHRSGCGYSQVSQRFVDGKKLRFVMRPEFQGDTEAELRFFVRIDRFAREYDEAAEKLVAKQKSGDKMLSGEARTDMKKKVQQVARSLLPNETEAPIFFTANVRALRHVIEMRANPAADVQIRGIFVRVCHIMKQVAPMLFSDHKIVALPDGTMGVETPWRKV